MTKRSIKRHTRRHFLKSSMVLGASLGLSATGLTHIARAQEDDAMTDMSGPLELTGNIRPVHDPVMIKENDKYYLFCTGPGMSLRKSDDMLHWTQSFPVRIFGNLPEWAQEKIPNQNDVWAPDVSYYNDKFHLYYSVSTFGSNRSVMGLLTNATLDHTSDDYEWVDEGLVLESTGVENYNCIDPNLILDQDGVPWLAFGSHWSGIKMRRLDYETGLPSEEDDTLYELAQRAIHPRAIEAPFIVFRDGYYYLFVSWDQCCSGVDSTYRVMVGRSESVTGPYVDKEGVDLMDDGGTQVTFPTDRWIGPGHNGIYIEDDVYYMVYHSYDAESQGVPTLRINPLSWDEDGWPYLESME